MAALRGCDSPFAIAAHAASPRLRGSDFVMRRYSRDQPCNLDGDEARSLSGAGLRIGALWETCVGVERLSRHQGLLDGADALRLARAAGQPPGSAIYFALGEEATCEAPRHELLQWPAARLVLDGAELRLSPVLGQPGRDPGLFQLAGRGAAVGVGSR